MCAVYCYVSYASLNRKTHGPQGHIPRDSDSVDLGRFWIASVVTSSPGDYGDQSGCWGWGRPGLECKKGKAKKTTGKRKLLEVVGMYMAKIVEMGSWVYTHLQIHQVVYIKYVLIF